MKEEDKTQVLKMLIDEGQKISFDGKTWKFDNKKSSRDKIVENITDKIILQLTKSKIEFDIDYVNEEVEKTVSYLDIIEEEKDSYSSSDMKKKIEKAIKDIIAKYSNEIPLRIHRPIDTKEVVFLIIKDFENKLIQPILAGSDKISRPEYLKSNSIMNNFCIKLMKELLESDIVVDIGQILEAILHYCIESINSENFRIGKFKTYSEKKDDWKISFIDQEKIDSASDEFNTWNSVKESIKDEEAWTLMCAWIYGIFDEMCVEHNRQALWLWGEGMDGKSVISSILTYIISGEFGDSYGSSTIGSGQLDKEFWASSIYGKSLTILNEVTDPNLVSGKFHDKMHAWLGHDLVPIELKNQNPFMAKLYSRCIITSNISPKFEKDHINNITRLIPVQFKKTAFKGLEYNGKDFKESTFAKDLYEERYSFLKFCKKCFKEKYSDQHLFSISNDYQDNNFALTERSQNIQQIAKYINPGNDIYEPNLITKYLKFIAQEYFGMKLSDRDLHNIHTNAGVQKKSVRIGPYSTIKAFSVSLDEKYVSAYNESVDRLNHGNQDLKLIPKDIKQSRLEKIDEKDDYFINRIRSTKNKTKGIE